MPIRLLPLLDFFVAIVMFSIGLRIVAIWFGNNLNLGHSYGALGSKTTVNDMRVKDIIMRIRSRSTDPSKTYGTHF